MKGTSQLIVVIYIYFTFNTYFENRRELPLIITYIISSLLLAFIVCNKRVLNIEYKLKENCVFNGYFFYFLCFIFYLFSINHFPVHIQPINVKLSIYGSHHQFEFPRFFTTDIIAENNAYDILFDRMDRIVSYIFILVVFSKQNYFALDEDQIAIDDGSGPRYCDEKCRLRSAEQVFHSPRCYFTFFFRSFPSGELQRPSSLLPAYCSPAKIPPVGYGKRENTIDGSVIFRAIEHEAQAAVGTG